MGRADSIVAALLDAVKILIKLQYASMTLQSSPQPICRIAEQFRVSL